MLGTSRRKTGRLFACCAATICAAGYTAAPAAAHYVTLILPKDFAAQGGPNQRPLVHPSSFVIDSADSNLHVRHLRWRGWGTQHAQATGQYDWCAPGCGGDWHPYTISASTIDAPGPGGCGFDTPFYLTLRQKFAGRWTPLPYGPIC
jgi:hypothetical protein